MTIHPLFTIHILDHARVLQRIGFDRSRAIHI